MGGVKSVAAESFRRRRRRYLVCGANLLPSVRVDIQVFSHRVGLGGVRTLRRRPQAGFLLGRRVARYMGDRATWGEVLLTARQSAPLSETPTSGPTGRDRRNIARVDIRTRQSIGPWRFS